MKLPNIRKLFVPDLGYTYFDMDLDRADLQVVVWECDDTDMKVALRKGLDMHCLNACAIFDIKGIPPEELDPNHPNYIDRRKQIGYAKRHAAKEGCHATNYYCQSRTLASTMGTSVAEAERFQRKWLGAHPGISRWHERTRAALQNGRTVYNRFGYRRFYFDRIDEILPEALAWVPQSTVACVINRIWIRINEACPDVEILNQVHDSLAGQFRTEYKDHALAMLREVSQVTIPYDDPLVIPSSVKTSLLSWGHCE